ncbi:hypothetical protein BJX62DRAFT_240856 [Aspergillus germanicus]
MDVAVGIPGNGQPAVLQYDSGWYIESRFVPDIKANGPLATRNNADQEIRAREGQKRSRLGSTLNVSSKEMRQASSPKQTSSTSAEATAVLPAKSTDEKITQRDTRRGRDPVVHRGPDSLRWRRHLEYA